MPDELLLDSMKLEHGKSHDGMQEHCGGRWEHHGREHE